MLYTYSDALGSLIALTNESGKLIERYAYDPWGQRRNPDQWELKDSRTHWIVNRGYTGHEHLDAFGIINMNGRVYDPLTAQFFSPDPVLQAPKDWLNYNRYGYCMGNPFKYTDPSGCNWLSWLFGPVTHWLFYTSEGYEFQKLISPISFHKIESHGSNVEGSGWEVSVGIPYAFPISYRYHYAEINYEKYYDNSFTGKMTVQGGEWSASLYNWGIPLRFTYGSNKYDGGADKTMNQTTNYYFLGNSFVNVRFEDDSDDLGWTFLPGMDHASGDKYRTSAGQVSFFGYTAGFKLMTGEQDATNDWKDNEGYWHHGEKNAHRLGLVYSGFNGNYSGNDSESNRNFLQNDLIHKPGQRKHPGSYYLWDVLNIPDKGYSHTGSTGGSSLWY